VIVGAYRHDNLEEHVGRAYVYLGSATGLGAAAAWSAEGDQAAAYFGLSVATAGDVDGDGYDEIVTGAGPGEVFGPHVRGWNYDALDIYPISAISSFAYGTPKWGVNVACGDIDGDGIDEIVTGPGPGNVFGPHVRGWNCDGGMVAPIPGVSYFAYGTLKWGVNVACGDLDGDGYDDLVVGGLDSSYDGQGGVLYGPTTGSLDLDEIDLMVGGATDDYLGWFEAGSAGDIDDDGYRDVLFGAPYSDATTSGPWGSCPSSSRATGAAATRRTGSRPVSSSSTTSAASSATQSAPAKPRSRDPRCSISTMFCGLRIFASNSGSDKDGR